MEQAARTPVSGRSAFEQLVVRVVETKYKLTPEEERVVYGCRDEAARGLLCGGVIGGAVAWGLTRRLKVPQWKLDGLEKFVKRIAVTLGGGLALGSWNVHRAIERCEERLAFLEGSPLQGEFIAILQKDYPNSPLFKRYLKHRTTQEVMYDVEGNMILNRLPVLNSSEQADHSFKGPSSGQQPVVNEQPSEQDSQSTLANFYELSLWNEAEDSGDAGSGQERAVKEKRRSRMSAAERRSYNREQFLSRERQQGKHQEAFSG